MVNMNEDFGAYKDSIWKGLTARELGVMAVSAVSCGIIIILLYFILGWNLYCLLYTSKKGSNADDGTSPDNPEGWVTYTYEGDSQTMVFYNGGTIQNVDGPGKGLTTVQSYPKDFTFTGGDAIFKMCIRDR